MKGQSFRSLIACLAVLAAGQTFSDRIAAAPFNEEVRIGIKLTQLRPKPRLMRRDEVVVVTAESLFLEGTAYAKTGHYKQAIACYERAVQLRPDWGAAHYNLGWTYGQVDRWQEAAASCQRALRLEPSFEEAHFYLGLSYVNLNLYDEAIESYERAIKINPRHAVAYNNLGNVYIYTEQYGEALKCFERCVELDPRIADAHNGRGRKEFRHCRKMETGFQIH